MADKLTVELDSISPEATTAELGALCKSRRESAGILALKLCDDIDIGLASYMKFEDGLTPLPLWKVLKILKALGFRNVEFAFT